MSSYSLVLGLKPYPEYFGWEYQITEVGAWLIILKILEVEPLPTPIEGRSTESYHYCLVFDTEVALTEVDEVLRALLALDKVFDCRFCCVLSLLQLEPKLVDGENRCELAQVLDACLAEVDGPFVDDVEILSELDSGQMIAHDYLEFLLSRIERLLGRGLLDAAEYLRRSRDTCYLTPGGLHYLINRRDEFQLDREITEKDLQSAFTDAYKAVEDILDGEPPRDIRGIEQRFILAQLDPSTRLHFVNGEQAIAEKMRDLRN